MKRSYLAVIALIVAASVLLPPMHDLSHDLFAWHMVQHLALVFVVAPLIAFAVPDLSRVPGSRFILGPVIVVILQAVALWAWHLPLLYDLALDKPLLHAVEHGSFIVTGTLFWIVVVGRSGSLDHLRRAAAVFVTGLQSAALGALLVFARSPLYDSHLATAPEHGLSPLEDQQLAGGIMWVPPGVVYLVITLGLFLTWMKHADRDEIAVADRSST